MARTRAKGGAASTATVSSKSTSASTKKESRYTLPEEMATPPQLFILPKKASSASRVVTLQNPRLSKPTRYLVCPDTGFYEFTRIAAPSSTPRSWLIDGARGVVKPAGADDEAETTSRENMAEDFETHIAKDGEIFVATPYDPVFLVLPALVSDTGKKRMFLTSDDHIDKLAETSPHLPQILRQQDKTRNLIEARMAAVCDTVEAGDENMYRLNESKLLGTLLAKARRLNLPKSMEERFVLKPLEAPVLTRRSQAQPITEPSSETDPDTPMTEKTESQASISSVETSSSATTLASVSTAPTEPTEDEPISAAMTASPEVISLQRLRVAFNFILSSYLPPSLACLLKQNLSSSSSSSSPTPKTADTDFAPLEDYLSKLAKLRAEVLASRAATDYSRKRGLDDLEDDRAEKKRKKEEEEKRKKAGESRGVKNLKKVNVTGMRKMSDFFKKKT